MSWCGAPDLSDQMLQLDPDFPAMFRPNRQSEAYSLGTMPSSAAWFSTSTDVVATSAEGQPAPGSWDAAHATEVQRELLLAELQLTFLDLQMVRTRIEEVQTAQTVLAQSKMDQARGPSHEQKELPASKHRGNKMYPRPQAGSASFERSPFQFQ